MAKKYIENIPTFSLFSKEELENQKYIHEVNILVEKYNILENENQLIASTDKNFLYLINYVLDLKEKNLTIPKDVEDIFLENIFLKEQINSFFQKNLENITKDSSLYFFKEINQIFSILALGTNEKVLDKNFDYDFQSISKLFRFYESLLKDLFETNIELFYLSFNSYTILLKTFIPLSKMNSIDIMKTTHISNIFELITETISMLKFSVLLDKEQLRQLSSIQGKYLFYFSHLDDIHIDKNDINLSIEKYFLCFEKQILGYALYQDNISKSVSLNSNEFLVHKNLSSILILKMLEKLDNILPNEEYIHTEYFQKILRDYYKTFFHEIHNFNTKKDIVSFRKDLLNSLYYNYSISFNFTKIVDYHSIIEDFIISENDFNNKNLESIHNLLQFIKNIDTLKYFYLVEILTDSKQIQNEYDEFHKLSIFHLLLNKEFEEKYSDRKIKIFNKILIYINENKASYQLGSIYDKLYADLSKFDLIAEKQESKSEDSKNETNKIILSYILDDDIEINY